MIRLSRESMEEAFVKYLETVFEHPEIIRASVRNIVINVLSLSARKPTRMRTGRFCQKPLF